MNSEGAQSEGPEGQKTRETVALAYALCAALLWSTVATAFKVALRHVSVSQLIFGASLTSVVVLGCLLAARGEISLALSSLVSAPKRAFLLGALNPVLYYGVLFEAYERLPAQVAQPLNYTWPVALSLLSALVRKQRLTRADASGMVLGYVGVVCISMAGTEVSGSLSSFGVGLALLSAFVWAGYWLKSVRDPRPPLIALFQNFLCALPLALGWMLMTEGMFSLKDSRALLSLAYVGAFEMGITFFLWQQALVHTKNAGQISTVIFVSPFLSLLWIWLILAEPLSLMTFFGLGLIVVGIFIQKLAPVPGSK